MGNSDNQIKRRVGQWLTRHPLTPIDIDCATAVMLKILDGKCRMPAGEKQVMKALYRQVRSMAGQLLGPETHELIRLAGDTPDETMRLRIYEQRVLAETRIARPRMKAFKAMIRERGLLKTGRPRLPDG